MEVSRTLVMYMVLNSCIIWLQIHVTTLHSHQIEAFIEYTLICMRQHRGKPKDCRGSQKSVLQYRCTDQIST